MVVAEFDVLEIIRDRVSILWQRTRLFSGIDEKSFEAYFEGREYGYAIRVGDVRVFEKPVCPIQAYGIKPPQSFAYVDIS